jgi:hypothetical protein
MKGGLLLGGGFGLPQAITLSVLVHVLFLWLPEPWRLTGGGRVSESRLRAPRYDVSWSPPGKASSATVAEAGSVPSPVAATRTPRPTPADAPTPSEAIRPSEAASLPAGDASSYPESSPGGTAAGAGSGLGGTEGSGRGSTSEGDGAESGAPRYQPPRLLAGALPIDPREVDALHVPPEIPVRIRVGADGAVLEVVPETKGLSAPVLEAVRRSAQAMRFSPARQNGTPVEAWFSMTFVHRP